MKAGRKYLKTVQICTKRKIKFIKILHKHRALMRLKLPPTTFFVLANLGRFDFGTAYNNVIIYYL